MAWGKYTGVSHRYLLGTVPPKIGESAKVSQKRVFALLTPEIRGWKMAQML